MSQGLLGVSTQELKKLQTALSRGRLRFPVTGARLRSAGLAGLSEHLALFEGSEPGTVSVWLESVLAERHNQQGAKLELVWTGPETTQTLVRDTARVVRDLFEKSEKSVLVGGCYFTQGEEILKPLYKAIRDRGVEATFCINIPGEASNAEGVEAYVGKKVREFIAENWPFGAPLPRFFYDPRTAAPGGDWLKLHSKCVVVDERHTFITSANFTFSGQNRNIETGVQIEDEDFARELTGHWRSLIRAGLLLEYAVQSTDLERCKLDVREQEWDAMRSDVEEDYWPLFDALKGFDLPAPDDIEELQLQGRVTGEDAICSWSRQSERGKPLALVRPGTQADNVVLLEVAADAEPKSVAEQLRKHLEVA